MDYKPYIFFAIFGGGIAVCNLIQIQYRGKNFYSMFTQADFTGAKIGGCIIGVDLLVYIIMLYFT